MTKDITSSKTISRKKGSKPVSLPAKMVNAIKCTAAKYAKASGKKKSLHKTTLCIKTTHGAAIQVVTVYTAQLAQFLQDVSLTLLRLRAPDPQFAMQNRTSAGKFGLLGVYGVTIDVDRKTSSIVGEVTLAGIPMPNVVFFTKNGFKLVFIFKEPVDALRGQRIAKWLTVAIEGGDPKSWDMSQFQHLPICLKTKNNDQYEVNFKPEQLNSAPLDAKGFSFKKLPPRMANVACGRKRELTVLESEIVEQFLMERHTPAPPAYGRTHYATCLNGKTHSSGTAFSIYRDENGKISAHCFGNHDGNQRNHWSEADIYRLREGAE